MQNFNIHIATADHLADANAVIANAIRAWPTTERLIRRAAPVLSYDQQDLLDHEIIQIVVDKRTIAIGAWQTKNRLRDPDGNHSALLHGLYIQTTAQKRGLGQQLQKFIARRASLAGFHGLHVKAERFAAAYFEHCGYRQLSPQDQPQPRNTPYPHWFWQSCLSIEANDLTDAG
ncbi:MAG: GNAT family N-acetyltransferase [Gammaproteobacteria bacterium]|jgi:N-acetylglutamate synthase-like GNAT family acetyltransferase|nr:GNAT family N-acetyltransferase [Gammaproteobacteria bacterium]MCH1551797.1 GNAT family N-acetyltransferase [Pseudomonadales bacterium]